MFAIHRQRETHLLDLPTEEIMKILHQFLLHVIVAFLSVDTHTKPSSVNEQAAAFSGAYSVVHNGYVVPQSFVFW